MAKLYAELTSDKGGRVASKGGDELLHIVIKRKNIVVAIVRVHSDSIMVHSTLNEFVHVSKDIK